MFRPERWRDCCEAQRIYNTFLPVNRNRFSCFHVRCSIYINLCRLRRFITIYLVVYIMKNTLKDSKIVPPIKVALIKRMLLLVYFSRELQR